MKIKLKKSQNINQEETIELEQLLANLEFIEEEPVVASRSIYLYGEIEPNVALKISQNIELINDIDNELEEKDKNYVREPITIFIDTVGGYCSAGSSIITAIKRSKTQVNGVVTGMCYSMGIPVLLSCDKKYSSSLGTFMIHSVSVESVSASSLKGYEYALESTRLVQKLIKGFIKRELDGKSKFYDDIVDNDRDVYFHQEKALEYGIIDEIDYEFLSVDKVIVDKVNKKKKTKKRTSRRKRNI